MTFQTQLQVHLKCGHTIVQRGGVYHSRVWDVDRLKDEVIVCPECCTIQPVVHQNRTNGPAYQLDLCFENVNVLGVPPGHRSN